MIHKYKGYIINKNGTKEYPWNIYEKKYTLLNGNEYLEIVGFDKTMRACKISIDTMRNVSRETLSEEV